jgi:hypothetical protein
MLTLSSHTNNNRKQVLGAKGEMMVLPYFALFFRSLLIIILNLRAPPT